MILTMPTPGENLKRLLEDQGRTPSWLAKRLGVASKQSVYDWINGRVPRDERIWEQVAQALGVAVDRIVEQHEPSNAIIASIPRSNDHINLVPYWGIVPCGEWEMPTSDTEYIQVSDAIASTDEVVAVRVTGDSLYPRFKERQVVCIKLSSAKRDGVVTLAKNQDNELTLKILRMTPRGWELQSINPDYPSVSADTVTILGYAISVEEHDTHGLRP